MVFPLFQYSGRHTLTENAFISSFPFMGTCTGNKVLCWQFFFSTLKVSFHCLLPFITSMVKSVLYLTVAPSKAKRFSFSTALYTIFSLFLDFLQFCCKGSQELFTFSLSFFYPIYLFPLFRLSSYIYIRYSHIFPMSLAFFSVHFISLQL